MVQRNEEKIVRDPTVCLPTKFIATITTLLLLQITDLEIFRRRVSSP